MAGIIRHAQILAAFSLLVGCASTPDSGPGASSGSVVRPTVAVPAGLEEVMNRNAAVLISRFGTPDLDVREAAARKLQFVNRDCILDAYLYPRSSGGEPVVTHVDARTLDGRDADRASCAASLSRRD